MSFYALVIRQGMVGNVYGGNCRGMFMPGFTPGMPGNVYAGNCRGMNSPAGGSNPLKRVGRMDLPEDSSHLPEDSSSGTRDHAANS
jgi:hypothetical protein